MLRRIILLFLGLVFLLTLPGDAPPPRRSFDLGRNGVWIGHQWYTGRRVDTGERVPAEERHALLRRLRKHRIRYVYLHAGPFLPDGTIRDRPGPELRALLQEAPDLIFLPWIGGGVDRLDLASTARRQSIVATVDQLRREGFPGVHLDIEPLRDRHPGYIELLRELRGTLGPSFILSHATRRAGPFGVAAGPLAPWFWSEGFYRDAMELTDQTVLMAYDTTLDSGPLYTRFVEHETKLLLDWGCEVPGHRVLIGIPSFEDSAVSNPAVENIPNAARGIRAALARHDETPSCFDGVALYAEWVTTPGEWRQLREEWNVRNPG